MYDESEGVTYVKSYAQITGTNSILKQIASHGPLNVGIAAGDIMFLYDGGILMIDSGCT